MKQRPANDRCPACGRPTLVMVGSNRTFWIARCEAQPCGVKAVSSDLREWKVERE